MNTKENIIKKLCTSLSLSLEDAVKVYNSIENSIINALAADSKVSITGLGNFERDDRNMRLNRNPFSGKPIRVVDNYTIRYRASDKFKDYV